MDANVKQKLETFFIAHKRRTYKKGEILIRADDDPRGIFYLRDGIVKEYAISQKGEELVVNIFKPIAFFPMTWGFNKTPNKYYFEAVTNVDIYLAPREAVISFLKKEPDVLFDLISRVYKGLDGILTKLTYLMAGNAYARLVTELIICAKRFGVQDRKQITIKISEKDLASQSGMTRETVSREIKILKQKGLVTLSGHALVIINLEKLEEELAEGV